MPPVVSPVEPRQIAGLGVAQQIDQIQHLLVGVVDSQAVGDALVIQYGAGDELAHFADQRFGQPDFRFFLFV